MANHKSAEKRTRQSIKRRDRNRVVRTRVRNVIKTVRQALEQKDAQAAETALSQAVSVIDRAASKGVLHRNNAARKISRLSRQVGALSA